MKSKIKKILLIIFAIWLILKSLDIFFLEYSIVKQLLNQYGLVWLGYVLTIFDIALIIVIVYKYLKGKKKIAFQLAFYFTCLQILNQIGQYLLSQANKDKLASWYYYNRLERGFPISKEKADMSLASNNMMDITFFILIVIHIAIGFWFYKKWHSLKH